MDEIRRNRLLRQIKQIGIDAFDDDFIIMVTPGSTSGEAISFKKEQFTSDDDNYRVVVLKSRVIDRFLYHLARDCWLSSTAIITVILCILMVRKAVCRPRKNAKAAQKESRLANQANGVSATLINTDPINRKYGDHIQPTEIETSPRRGENSPPVLTKEDSLPSTRLIQIEESESLNFETSTRRGENSPPVLTMEDSLPSTRLIQIEESESLNQAVVLTGHCCRKDENPCLDTVIGFLEAAENKFKEKGISYKQSDLLQLAAQEHSTNRLIRALQDTEVRSYIWQQRNLQVDRRLWKEFHQEKLQAFNCDKDWLRKLREGRDHCLTAASNSLLRGLICLLLSEVSPLFYTILSEASKQRQSSLWSLSHSFLTHICHTNQHDTCLNPTFGAYNSSTSLALIGIFFNHASLTFKCLLDHLAPVIAFCMTSIAISVCSRVLPTSLHSLLSQGLLLGTFYFFIGLPSQWILHILIYSALLFVATITVHYKFWIFRLSFENKIPVGSQLDNTVCFFDKTQLVLTIAPVGMLLVSTISMYVTKVYVNKD